jgi:hypothetical protein
MLGLHIEKEGNYWLKACLIYHYYRVTSHAYCNISISVEKAFHVFHDDMYVLELLKVY